MNKKVTKNKATLESLSKLITKSVANLATKDELHESISGLATKDELHKSISGLATKDDLNIAISNLPTRDEMNTAIENAVDDLARTVAVGFAGVDKRFEELEQKVNRNYTGLSNQLDYVLLHYTRRDEYEKLDVRVKKLEKVC